MTDGFAILPDATVAALHKVRSRHAYAMAIAVARQAKLTTPWSAAELDEYAGLPRGDRRGRRARAELTEAGIISEKDSSWSLCETPRHSCHTGHQRPDTHVRPDTSDRTPVSAPPDTSDRTPGHQCPVSPYTRVVEEREESGARPRTYVATDVPKEVAKRNRERPEVDVMRVWCEAWKDRTGKAPIKPVVYRTLLERFILWVVDTKQPATPEDRDEWIGAAVDVVLANPWATREDYAPRCVARLLQQGDVQTALDAMTAPGVRQKATKPTTTNGEQNGRETDKGGSASGATVADYKADFGEELDLGGLLGD